LTRRAVVITTAVASPRLAAWNSPNPASWSGGPGRPHLRDHPRRISHV